MSGGPRSSRTHRSTIHPLMCLVHITGCPHTVRVSFSLACHSQRYRWFDLLNGRSKDTDYCKYSTVVLWERRFQFYNIEIPFKRDPAELPTVFPPVRLWRSYGRTRCPIVMEFLWATPFYRNGQSTCSMLYEKVRFLLAFRNDNCLFKNRGCSFVIFKINPLVKSCIRISRFSLVGI